MKTPDIDLLLKEVKFQFTRSSGKGGQHVNKVETKVELYFDIPQSKVLNGEQKELLIQKLANKISSEGILKITSQAERTQLKNKDHATRKFFLLITKCFIQKKKRHKTQPPQHSKEQRRKDKKIISQIKQSRQKPDEH